MTADLGYLLVLTSAGFVAYAYAGYPILLKALAILTGGRTPPRDVPAAWPKISITVPMYNEEDQAAELVESLLALDYPADRRQILIVSDASTDRTDEIVKSYADRGVELLRQEERAGKTAAENAAALHLTGEIVVNTDASIRVRKDALKPLVAAFRDPEVGLASGRDVSVTRTAEAVNVGESGYVGYEMWIRDLETRISGIVGASGCLYAIRADLHRIELPESLSRDFAAALNCREHGYRAVSVPRAVCYVPRTASLRREYRRKVRTITRGIDTLQYKRALLNPFRSGIFAWMLFSHKVCRWASPWAALAGLAGLILLSPTHSWARILGGLAAISLGAALVGWAAAGNRSPPRILEVPAYLLMSNVAAMHAAIRSLLGDRDPVWEPTRREGGPTTPERSRGDAGAVGAPGSTRRRKGQPGSAP